MVPIFRKGRKPEIIKKEAYSDSTGRRTDDKA